MRALTDVSDVLWNYCDVKCTYLERYFPNTDFLVGTFRNKQDGSTVGACYIKNILGKLVPWNHEANNQFYSDLCGNTDIDFAKDTDNYELVKLEGEGIGNNVSF